MNRTIYTPEQVRTLLTNSNVERCSSKSVSYSKEFKVQAVKDYYHQGLGPNVIFQKAGFDLEILGKYKPENCLKLWRKIYKAQGQAGLKVERRGKNSSGRRRKGDESNHEYLKAKIAYLESENAFLKQQKTKTNS
jgi:transposase